METQIIILLLVFLRATSISAQLGDIPPAPTLPKLDVSTFPEYMQRLLANRLSRTYPNSHEARDAYENSFRDHVNRQIPEGTFDTPGTNGMSLVNDKVHSSGHTDTLKNHHPQPSYVRKFRKIHPRTYGMNLSGDNGEIWNDFTGTHLHINDFAPSKSIHPNLLHNKEDEPNNTDTSDDNKSAKSELINNDYNQKLLLATKLPGIQLPHKKPAIPTITEGPKEVIATQKPNAATVAEVEVDINVNNEFQQNKPAIQTNNPDIVQTIPQFPPQEIPTIATFPPENELKPENPKENVVVTDETEIIKQSFDNILAFNNPDKDKQSFNIYGMQLTGDRGYVWNYLNKPGYHYNVGTSKNSDTKNQIPEEEEINNSENPTETSNTSNATVSNDETPGPNIVSGNTNALNVTTTTEVNQTNEEPSTHSSLELDDLLKKYIEKLVKEEIAKQLDNTSTNAGTNKNSSIANDEVKKGDDMPSNDNTLETNETPATNKESTNGYNNYGTITGNGKITNIFVFGYPNENSIKSTVNASAILNKPVSEIINDVVNNNKPESIVPSPIITSPANSPVDMKPNEQPNNSYNETDTSNSTINMTPNQETNNSYTEADMEISKNKDNDIDTGNQTTQPTISEPAKSDATTSTDSEDAISKPISENASIDVAVQTDPSEDPLIATASDTQVTEEISTASDITLPTSNS